MTTEKLKKHANPDTDLTIIDNRSSYTTLEGYTLTHVSGDTFSFEEDTFEVSEIARSRAIGNRLEITLK